MPQALLDRPILNEFLLQYHEAFNDLNAQRQYGMAELPLQVSEIKAYADTFGFRVDMRFFYRAMAGMDSEYMGHRAEQRKQEADNNGSKG